MKEEAVEALSSLVKRSFGKLDAVYSATSKEISDLYACRDIESRNRWIDEIPEGGVSINDVPHPSKVSDWNPPETTANLFLSRLRAIVTALVPGTPTLEVKARTPGAVYSAEHQNELSEWATDHGRLEKAMRRASFLGMVSPYFGLKFVPKPDEKDMVDRAEFLALEPTQCGYEPFHRRFTYHHYEKDFGTLPDSWKATFKDEKPNDWDPVAVTEVYHDGFRYGGVKGEYPMSIFVDLASKDTRDRRKRMSLGNYIGTEDLPICPLVISSFLDAPPNEDVAPAECLSWIPLMRMIIGVLGQIDREIQTINNINLYDKQAIRQEIIRQIVESPRGSRLFVGVDVDDAQRGVNATLRPVEMNSVLPEYLSALNTYIALFDDVTGVSAMERGTPLNPEKSATEAAAITQNASRRNKDRLEVISDAWGDIARVHHAWQRKLYGKTVEIPLATGLTRTINVPDPKVSSFSFRVDPVDLEHISRKGEIESLLTFLQQATQTVANFRGSIPKVIREILRRTGKAMGITDVDLLLEAPAVEQGPEDRIIRYLLTGEPIPVSPGDDHELYVSYYQNLLLQGTEDGFMPSDAGVGISAALQAHQRETQKAALEQQQKLAEGTAQAAPGMGALANEGIAAPALRGGQVPLLGPRGAV
jgi:hypothetical protein